MDSVIDSVGSHADIIEAFGGPAAYGRAIGIPESHARTMKARNSISPGYWRPTVAAARERRLRRVSFVRLAMIAALAAEKRIEAAAQ